MRIPVALLAVLSLVPATRARAETLYVDATGLAPFVEIQDAIDVAVEGDVVLVLPGTYGPIDFLGKGLTVRSTAGTDVTFIDATAAGGAAVIIDDFTPPHLLLHGFTITGGTGFYEPAVVATVGGGVLVNRSAEGRITGNVITGNQAEQGAGFAVLDSMPEIYGNVVSYNSASVAGGGGLLLNPTVTWPIELACNQYLGNWGAGAGGLYLADGVGQVTSSVFNGNTGERGGLWVAAPMQGSFVNNTLVANQSTGGSAAGLESDSDSFGFSSNVVASNLSGWGVIRSTTVAAWGWNDVWSNGLGEYSGAAGDPTGTAGNLSQDPLFVLFTPGDPEDDDLNLVDGAPLLDMGDPDPDMADLDGSLNGIGYQGGPHLACDLDGDGVRPDEGDCRPDEGFFAPDLWEPAEGKDRDCDGWGSLEIVDFTLDDGALTPSGPWEFGEPDLLPGRGHGSVSAWCTGCGATTSAEAGELLYDVDLTGLPVGTGLQLQLVHAWDLGATADAARVELYEPVAGVWDELATFSGTADSWTTDGFDITAAAGLVAELRFRLQPLASPSAGWSIGRISVRVVDADGDGRSAVLTDCDDADATIYSNAPEVPYDTIDQDCDGADLTDADGDGHDAVVVGGDDCDDTDPAIMPGGLEVPYDSIDQDCDGADLVDVDSDGSVAEVAGGDDCDDNDDATWPGAPEVPYDDVDQDCDGQDLTDVDGDGVPGNEAPPFGDCDDTDPAVHPDADEVCGDGVDNDCDGAIDVLPDGDGDGWDLCDGDCDDFDPTVNPAASELCDGVDTDCDGAIPADEADADLDGELPCGGDCDDADDRVAEVFPEVCDGVDNNCDLAIDEGHDLDRDGFSSCTDDCDDQRSSVHPGAELDCTNSLDNDCDGAADFEQDECLASTGCEGCEGSLVATRSQGPVLALALAVALACRRRREDRA
jgi:hypothetical protein